MTAMAPGIVEITAASIFAIALIHTFSTRYFQHLAHVQPAHAGLWHLLGEVEVVFGFWAMVLLIFLVVHGGTGHALQYLESRNFTEPAFVFVIMVIAASRPIIDLAGALLQNLSRVLPLTPPVAYYFTVLSIGPLLGSFITEPAAMTLAALLLRERFFSRNAPKGFLYATVGVLFVNISIGGTLTPYAAPPVLMVADKWGLDLATMLKTFGWKAAIAVVVNAAGAAFVYRKYLCDQPTISPALARLDMPGWVVSIHLTFLTCVVVFSHHPIVFVALFLFFLGFAEAYRRYQTRLMLREGLMVAFFLGGLVVLGGQQKWWLQPVLTDLSPTALYYGATLLTAITDNAALTYLGSLVDGVSDAFKYSMVAGAVTGGGLTVIANAPNPAGFAILKGSFEDGAIGALGLAAAATLPTLVAVAAFQLLPG
ncbi:MAG TPA: putative Na+/H+ antiporter [Hyphomicrobiaceae bacterium]|nr:putative Na+/H+ antiporter [Hyphomicrobiaceae bacterium]